MCQDLIYVGRIFRYPRLGMFCIGARTINVKLKLAPWVHTTQHRPTANSVGKLIKNLLLLQDQIMGLSKLPS